MDIAVDFIRVYADRTHHGKEEAILFRELKNKPLSTEDRRVMNELIEEHVFGRQTTKTLVDANIRYRNGDKTALADISDTLQTISSTPSISRKKTKGSSLHPEPTSVMKTTKRCWQSSGSLIGR